MNKINNKKDASISKEKLKTLKDNIVRLLKESKVNEEATFRNIRYVDAEGFEAIGGMVRFRFYRNATEQRGGCEEAGIYILNRSYLSYYIPDAILPVRNLSFLEQDLHSLYRSLGM